ncbi:V-type proton ATPase 116 kDa subunit a 1-like [Periplaneta americana]|uniref:V-type proton ATPase 116 kDa subunit a 1-like n=1 Tax=Periplaneta americana TaxID=6978 RepID=UPI0037E83B21
MVSWFQAKKMDNLQYSQIEQEQAPLLEEAENIPLMDEDHSLKLRVKAGVILQDKIAAFQQMLWRVCRGNIYFQFKPIETPTEDPVLVLNRTSEQNHRILLACARNLKMYFLKVLKMKSVYFTLNMCNVDVKSSYLIAQCWMPISSVSSVNKALITGTEKSGSTLPPVMSKINTTDIPPTYNPTNKFTKVFQDLIDAYGYSSYGEINPVVFTTVTFPFLFAVMFGDVGHGILLTCAGLMIWINEKRINWDKTGEIMKIFFNGRYLIIMMGVFSIYTGSIYNEFFAVPFKVFHSQWTVNFTAQTVMHNERLDLDPENDFLLKAYPFGIDPMWQLSENGLSFANSFKMKLSVILGIFHMLFGIFLSMWNYIYFRTKEDVIGKFVPQLLFMSSIFLYMIFLIFFKWSAYGPHKPFQKGIHCSPSILTTLILMVLNQDPRAKGTHCHPYMFRYQKYIQRSLLIMAFVCVPWLLLFKPIYTLIHRRRKPGSLTSIGLIMNADSDGTLSLQPMIGSLSSLVVNPDTDSIRPTGTTEIMSVGELFIYQGIETIEYVLSCVSHTASYLRLWALSLAHSQLSVVLWSMVFRVGLRMGGPFGFIGIALSFSVWAVLTIAIMVLMEGLSAFLHTLRLHWVEFQSKFYGGKGYKFTPFSFKTIIREVNLLVCIKK